MTKEFTFTKEYSRGAQKYVAFPVWDGEDFVKLAVEMIEGGYVGAIEVPRELYERTPAGRLRILGDGPMITLVTSVFADVRERRAAKAADEAHTEKARDEARASILHAVDLAGLDDVIEKIGKWVKSSEIIVNDKGSVWVGGPPFGHWLADEELVEIATFLSA